MTQPRTIDSGSPDYADAINEAENARQHMATAIEAREVARFYSGDNHGIDCFEAEVRIGKLLADSVAALGGEQKALCRLNAILLHAGGSADDVFLVGRGLYRASRPGQLAVYLGQELPGYEEIVAAFEPLPTEDEERDELAERASEYCEMIRFDR